MVFTVNQCTYRLHFSFTQARDHATHTAGPSTSTSKTATTSLPSVRQTLLGSGLSPEAENILLQSWRTSTRKQYDSYLARWASFAESRGDDPNSPTPALLVNYLGELFQTGLGYSALNTARSAVSSLTLGALGSNVLVKRFLRGAFNMRPTLRKHAHSWDPAVVLSKLKQKGYNDCLTLKDLTLKLAMLLALVSGQRVQTLAALDLTDLSVHGEVLIFRLSKLLKQTRPGFHPKDIELRKYVGVRLCVVRTLKDYVRRTRKLNQSTALFVSYQKPHAPVGKATISRWIKTVLAQCGIHKQFTAHSTRSASTSKACFADVPVDLIMEKAGWTRQSTFTRFYKRPVVKSTDPFADAVLKVS